ncbi:MAG TPA: ATP-grasp domain-containing protein [Bacteroidota bacterium]|nr:ATP-grasp domain-containing protein [Bacteroidota bacterium]
MPRKTRVSILYNQPVTVDEDRARFAITESGTLAKRASSVKKEKMSMREMIDLSEVGVVEEMDDIKDALNSIGYKTTTFNVDGDVYRLIDYLKNEPPDVIFNLVECVENQAIQEMHVAGLYELMKIAYTGAGPLALGLALHKPRVKELLTYHGIRTPGFRVFRAGDKITAPDLPFPMIVKPSSEDASVGIEDSSVVESPAELRRRVQYVIEEYDQPALVEEFIDGRELNVAILGSRRPLVLPISEIDFSGLKENMRKIVTYEAKWMHGTIAYDGTKGVCPAQLPSRLEAEMKAIALRCFHIVGCRDYARVDFRLSKAGVPYVLEVNPNPDISDDAGFARSARTYGFTYPEAIGKIVESTFERIRA